LSELYAYIADTANRSVAGGYLDRIERACLSLAAFPERGRSRDDIHPGLRTIAFERRALIVFRIGRTDVEIVRVLYGGRDIRGEFPEE
jgi:toxin ParE1/3/4